MNNLMIDFSDPDCAVRRIFDLLSDKWTIRVLYILSLETQRYNQLRRELPGISHKMLTQVLKQLEQDHLVKREVFPEIPPHVEYSLSELGQSLIPHLFKIVLWAIEHSADLGWTEAVPEIAGTDQE